MAIRVCGGGNSQKVTIDGKKPQEKMNLSNIKSDYFILDNDLADYDNSFLKSFIYDTKESLYQDLENKKYGLVSTQVYDNVFVQGWYEYVKYSSDEKPEGSLHFKFFKLNKDNTISKYEYSQNFEEKTPIRNGSIIIKPSYDSTQDVIILCEHTVGAEKYQKIFQFHNDGEEWYDLNWFGPFRKGEFIPNSSLPTNNNCVYTGDTLYYSKGAKEEGQSSSHNSITEYYKQKFNDTNQEISGKIEECYSNILPGKNNNSVIYVSQYKIIMDQTVKYETINDLTKCTIMDNGPIQEVITLCEETYNSNTESYERSYRDVIIQLITNKEFVYPYIDTMSSGNETINYKDVGWTYLREITIEEAEDYTYGIYQTFYQKEKKDIPIFISYLADQEDNSDIIIFGYNIYLNNIIIQENDKPEANDQILNTETGKFLCRIEPELWETTQKKVTNYFGLLNFYNSSYYENEFGNASLDDYYKQIYPLGFHMIQDSNKNKEFDITISYFTRDLKLITTKIRNALPLYYMYQNSSTYDILQYSGKNLFQFFFNFKNNIIISCGQFGNLADSYGTTIGQVISGEASKYSLVVVPLEPNQILLNTN